VELWEAVAVRANGISNLTFLERVPYHEIQGVYDRARFLVSTSETEGFPNVMIHAAQGGAAILSLDLDPDGLISHFGAGFCAEGDFEQLVSRAGEFLTDPDSPGTMGKGAQRMLGEWLDNAANTEAFLKGLS
jgi:hypothetical protein